MEDGSWKVGIRKLEVRIRKLEFGSWKVGIWKLKFGSWNSEVGIQKLEDGTWKFHISKLSLICLELLNMVRNAQCLCSTLVRNPTSIGFLFDSSALGNKFCCEILPPAKLISPGKCINPGSGFQIMCEGNPHENLNLCH